MSFTVTWDSPSSRLRTLKTILSDGEAAPGIEHQRTSAKMSPGSLLEVKVLTSTKS